MAQMSEISRVYGEINRYFTLKCDFVRLLLADLRNRSSDPLHTRQVGCRGCQEVQSRICCNLDVQHVEY